jgi:glycosyltransferase involved in cell wall biosynthesis
MLHKKTAFFTICSNNFMAYSRTLIQSAKDHHPNVDFYIFLADEVVDVDGFYPDRSRVIPAGKLPIPDFDSFAFQYEIMELNTAIKPTAFINLFNKGYDYVLYFDPDIEVFHPLTSIFDLLDAGASFVLTPHLCSPAEEDSEPNDVVIMRAGIYNLGFLACSWQLETQRMLHWWARHLRFECVSKQEAGIFVDQKFMDLIPAFTDNSRVLRDTTVNAAYFNLGQRKLTQQGANWFIDGRPLSFFHFSGIEPSKTDQLSKYTNQFRGEALTGPLQELILHYCEKLAANGQGTIPRGIYAYERFDSGTPIHKFVRHMFRERHLPWCDDPFKSYEEFVHLPDVGTPRHSGAFIVTNFMKYVWEQLPYIRNNFDLARADHVEAYVRWYVEHAQSHWHLDSRLVEPVAVRAGARPPVRQVGLGPEAARADITVIGYFTATSGVGEVGRQTVKTLSTVGLSVDAYDVAIGLTDDRRMDANFDSDPADEVSGRIQIFNINADQLPHVMRHVQPRSRHDAYRIAIPFWELAEFPAAWFPSFDDIDEIWAPSRFIQTALFRKINRPVVHMPVALPFSAPAGFNRAYFSLPESSFLFFFAFDFLSFQERKNPRAAYRAFRRAFPDKRNGDVGLVVKALNGQHLTGDLAALREELADDPGVIFIDKSLTRSEMLGLIDQSDCVVSLHRSEGLGLLVAEAMMLEKPVIATDYSGTTDILTPSTGFPVDYRLIPVGEGQYPFAAGKWADPDEAHAAWQMRRVLDDRSVAREKARLARRFVEKHHGLEHVAALQQARLRVIGLH